MAMTETQIGLIRCLAENRIEDAKKQAIACCDEDTSRKNEIMCSRLKAKLVTQSQNTMSLPAAIKGMAVAEDVSSFRTDRYFLSAREAMLLQRVQKANSAALRLAELGIPYLNSVLLTGESGTGKTMFGRFVAHEMELPFLYVNFSYLIDSYMGVTSRNLRSVFEYAKNSRCVFMLDEIDAIARQRGKSSSGGDRELSNTTITLLQELDQIKNDTILFAATNIPDAIDKAVARRFAIRHEMLKPSKEEIEQMVQMYAASVNMTVATDLSAWAVSMCGQPQSRIINAIIEAIAEAVLSDKNEIFLSVS